MAEKESAKETVLQVIFFIRGYHEYQEICTLEIDDEYELEREPLNSQRKRWARGGVLPYMGYIGMCRPKGYGF